MSIQETPKRAQYFKEREPLEYPIRRSEGIESGKVYRTRSGTRAQIYNITDRDVHGSVLLNGVWEVYAWSIDGRAKEGNGRDHANDLILAKPLKLEAGQVYKSRDGRITKVHEINKGSPEYPVIGAIKGDRGEWLPRVWNEKGITKIPYGPNNDIVDVWEDN